MIEYNISAWKTGGDKSKPEASHTGSSQTTAELTFARWSLKYEAEIATGEMFVQLVARKPQSIKLSGSPNWERR